MNLFIDTNIWLSFYDFTSSDLDQLEKIKGYMEVKRVRLLLPEQVIDEFDRNREVKFQLALKTLESHKAPSFPAFCKDYPEYEAMRNASKAFEATRKSLLEKVELHFSERRLRADAVIDPLFAAAEILPTTDIILAAARNRMTKGNPPRKNSDHSHGDAINWECLLSACDPGSDIYVVANDSDYCSVIDKKQINPFLFDEWHKKKEMGRVFYFDNLVEFTTKHLPDIDLEDERKKGKVQAEVRDVFQELINTPAWILLDIIQEYFRDEARDRETDTYDFIRLLSVIAPSVEGKGDPKAIEIQRNITSEYQLPPDIENTLKILSGDEH